MNLDIDSEFIALDLETRDPDLLTLGPGWAFPQRGGYPTGYSLAWQSGGEMKSVYLPVRHEGGGNMLEGEVRSILAPILSDKRRTVVMANCLYDYGWCRQQEFEWNAQLDDVQIQAPLLDDNRYSYSLNNLAKDYLDGRKKEESGLYAAAKDWGLKDFKGDMWRLPAAMVDEYARVDAELTLELYFKLQDEMAAQDLEEVHDLERRLVPVLYEMRRRGVRVDLKECEILQREFLNNEEVAQKNLELLTDVPIDPWAAASIVKALEAEGVEDFPLTPKKKEKSVDNAFLESIAGSGDSTAAKIAANVRILRKWRKARSAFVENMMMGHAINGRIHSELKALRSDEGGTVSGRFSCVNPNLQQVPARDPEIGPLIRSLLLPDEGEWAAIDYSSQEPRLAVHFGAKARVTGAKEMADLFRKDPRMDPYLPTAKLCGIERKDAKTIKLGILYGMGGGSMSASLGLPTEKGTWKGREVLYAGPEGKKILENYHRNSPMDRELSNLAQNNARKRNWVKTVLGRRSRFPRRENGEVWFTHKALNRVIQGSAADMTKKAMVDIWEQKGVAPLVSVHDELGFDVTSHDEAREYAHMMENAIPLEVPIVTDIEIGPNWGASMGNKMED